MNFNLYICLIFFLICTNKSFYINSYNISKNIETSDNSKNSENVFSEDRNKKRSIHDLNNNYFTNKREKRGVLEVLVKSYKHWPSFPIPYYVYPNVTFYHVKKAVEIIMKETCITFIERRSPIEREPGLNFIRSVRYRSYLGKAPNNKPQTVELSDRYAYGGCLHEIFHALGIFHEHCRFDRNSFVHVNLKNILPESQLNYQISDAYTSQSFGLFYDYGSVMHYGLYDYSTNKFPAMSIVHKHYKTTPGQQEITSFSDIETLNLFYCRNICSQKIICFNGGYQDPNKCDSCKCIEGFVDQFCRVFVSTSIQCGKTTYIALGETQYLTIEGKKKCQYYIKSKKRRKILIQIAQINIFPESYYTCSSFNNIEIKYWVDKRSTGARYCNYVAGINIVSENDIVIIYYKSIQHANNAYIAFKEYYYR